MHMSKKMGKDFEMKTFHDQVLSYGSIAPKYVKELMGFNK